MYLYDMTLCLFEGGDGAAAATAQGETQASAGNTRQSKTGALDNVKYGKQPESEVQQEQPDAGAEKVRAWNPRPTRWKQRKRLSVS